VWHKSGFLDKMTKYGNLKVENLDTKVTRDQN